MRDRTEAAGAVALLSARILVAAIFLWHGVPKAFKPAAAIDKFVGFGLPGIMGPITGVVEVVAAVLLVAGLFPRGAAMTLGVIIVGALATVQIPAGITPGLERDLLILLAIVVLLVFGPGTVSLDAFRKRSGARRR